MHRLRIDSAGKYRSLHYTICPLMMYHQIGLSITPHLKSAIRKVQHSKSNNYKKHEIFTAS